jgi:hypothetical protein
LTEATFLIPGYARTVASLVIPPLSDDFQDYPCGTSFPGIFAPT